MSTQIGPEAEALIRESVDSGRYSSADEAVNSAFSMLDESDRKRQRLLDALTEGAKGEAIPYTPEFREIDREVDERLRQGDQPIPDVCP